MSSVADQYERYYFFYDDNGNLTCQLSNESMQECVATTMRAFNEARRVALLAELRILLTYAYQQHEDGGLKKLEQRMEAKLNDLIASTSIK